MRDSQNTAQTLTESLKYFLKYRDQTVVIKYGGNAMIDEKVKESILKDILLLKTVGIKVVLVHGGGPAIGELLEKYEQKSQFVQGLRVTDKKTAQLALTALAGKVNKSLVQDIIRLGGNAIGVSGIDGKLIEAKPISEDLGYVGEITAKSLSVSIKRMLFPSLLRPALVLMVKFIMSMLIPQPVELPVH